MKFEPKSTHDYLAVLAAVVLAFVPVVVFGADKYAPTTQTQNDIVGSVKSIWHLVAMVAVFGGLIGAVVTFIWDRRYVWYALGIAAIGAFGESFVIWALSLGGISIAGH